MNRPSPCRSAIRLRALGVRTRAPPGCRYFCPRLPARGFGRRRPASPDYPTQQRKGTEKAEGKIKGDGTGMPFLLGLHDGYRGTRCVEARAADFDKALNL